MVVAGDEQHAAVHRAAGMVAVLEDVAAAVNAGALAVPHGEDAVILRRWEKIQLLGAPDSGCGDVLVDAGLEGDVMRLEVRLGGLQGLIEAAQRRTAVAGYIAGGVQPGGLVAAVLQHGQARKRLYAGEEDAPTFQFEFVIE